MLLRAANDLVCASSACPDDIDPANAWECTDVHVRVYPAQNRFSMAVAHRVTADAEPELSKETAFHPRTSQLTRSFVEYRGYWLPHCYDNEGAVSDWTKAIEMNSKMASAYLNRGVALLKIGKVDEAAADLDRAIALDAKDAKAYGHRGFAWMLLNDFARALADFNEAAKLNPQLPWVLEGRGCVRLMRNELEQAIADFDQAIAAALASGREELTRLDELGDRG